MGHLINVLSLIGITLLFALSLSVLWGWYLIGVVSCVMLVCRLLDERKTTMQILRRRIYLKPGEWLSNVYVVSITGLSVLVNLLFVVLHLLGYYAPPFGDVPIRP